MRRCRLGLSFQRVAADKPLPCLSINFVLCKLKCFLAGLETINCETSPSQKDLREPSGPTEGSGVVSLQRGPWNFPTWEPLP